MKYAKVQDNPGLLKDVNSGAVVNVDDVAYSAYLKNKNMQRARLEREEAQEKRINTLENRLANMESTLGTILEILTNGNKS